MSPVRDIGVTQQERDAVRDPRTNMFMAAVLHWAGRSAAVTLRNLSPTGALVEGAVLPTAGEVVHLVRGSLRADGDIAWSVGRRCGVRLQDLIDVPLWMAPPGKSQPIPVGLAAEAARSLAFPLPVPNLNCRSGEQASISLLKELERLLHDVSDDLASDPATVARHGAQLQKLDLIAQGLVRMRGSIRPT